MVKIRFKEQKSYNFPDKLTSDNIRPLTKRTLEKILPNDSQMQEDVMKTSEDEKTMNDQTISENKKDC